MRMCFYLQTRLKVEAVVNTEKAIEDAYAAHIATLYKALSQAVLLANGDQTEIAAAEARFSKGLAHVAEVGVRARRLAGLE